MRYKTTRAANLKTSRWSGGTTTELFIWPESANVADRDFDLRVSTATVELDESDFSDYSGYIRRIMPLDGCMTLTHDGSDTVALGGLESTTFDGGRRTCSSGKCRDFNLIHRPSWTGGIGGVLPGERFECPAPGFSGIYALADGIIVTLVDSDEKHNLDMNKGDFLLVECDDSDKVSIELSGPPSKTRYIAAAFVARG